MPLRSRYVDTASDESSRIDMKVSTFLKVVGGSVGAAVLSTSLLVHEKLDDWGYELYGGVREKPTANQYDQPLENPIPSPTQEPIYARQAPQPIPYNEESRRGEVAIQPNTYRRQVESTLDDTGWKSVVDQRDNAPARQGMPTMQNPYTMPNAVDRRNDGWQSDDGPVHHDSRLPSDTILS